MGSIFLQRKQYYLSLNIIICGNNIPEIYKVKNSLNFLDHKEYIEYNVEYGVFSNTYIRIKNENNEKIVNFVLISK